MQKGLALIIIVLILAGIIALASGAYYLCTKKSENFQNRLNEQNPMVFPSKQLNPTNKPLASNDRPNLNDETANWKIYSAQACVGCKSFSFKYPPSYQVRTDYAPSGLGKVLVDSKGSDIDHYPLSNEELVRINSLGVNTRIGVYPAFEQTTINSDRSGNYEISLLDFPEKGQGQKFMIESKEGIYEKIEEFKQILQSVTVN